MKKKLWPLNAKSVSNLIVVLVGILFYILLSNFEIVRQKIGVFLEIFSPFIAGFIVAYLLNTPAMFFERKVYRKLRFRRGLSILTVYLLAIALVAVLLNMVIPQALSSVVALVNNLEGYLKNLNEWADELIARFHLEAEEIDAMMVSYQDLVKKVAGVISNALPELLDFGVALGSGVIAAITALISSVYMLSGKKTLTVQVKKLLYALFPTQRVKQFLHICRRSNDIFLGFINGKLIDSAIIGVLCFILCTIFRIPFALLISVIVGVTNVIPFFGPFVGAIPSVMILLIVDPWAALRFGILIIALQQFDGNILGPKILGNYTGLSAIWVLVAIVVGGGMFGFIGMLLGVPVFAVIYMLTRDFVSARLTEKQIDGEGRSLAPETEPQPDQETNGQ